MRVAGALIFVRPRLAYPRVTVFIYFLDLKDLTDHRQNVTFFILREFFQPFPQKAQEAHTRTDLYRMAVSVFGKWVQNCPPVL